MSIDFSTDADYQTRTTKIQIIEKKNKITEHKVALAKNTRMKSRRDNLDQSPFTTGGQKTDRAHSFTYGARTGHRSRHNEILDESCNSDAVWIPTT